MDCNAPLAGTMNEVTWLCQLSYLADIFNKMKYSNKSEAITILQPFATTYLRETGFLANTATKTKY